METRGFGLPGYTNMRYPLTNQPPLIRDRDLGTADYNPVSSYRTTFTVPESWAGRSVVLRFDGVYSAYDVWVNGEKAGSIAYPPYQLEVTKYLQSGKNSIEIRLIGSMGNLYGPHYSQSMGIMGPWMWNGIQEQLPGAQYRSFNYGLEEDFRLMY